jgi:hypothetical protein
MNFFDTLTPDQKAQFQSEACGLISATRKMGLDLAMTDLMDLTNQRFKKILRDEAIKNGQY